MEAWVSRAMREDDTWQKSALGKPKVSACVIADVGLLQAGTTAAGKCEGREHSLPARVNFQIVYNRRSRKNRDVFVVVIVVGELVPILTQTVPAGGLVMPSALSSV